MNRMKLATLAKPYRKRQRNHLIKFESRDSKQ